VQGFSPPRDGGLKSEAKCANSLFLPNLNLPPRSRAEGGGDDVTLIGVVDCGAQPVRSQLCCSKGCLWQS